MQRHILIRRTDSTTPGQVLTFDADQLTGRYSAAELSSLSHGLPVNRAPYTHVDLLAFHDRHADDTHRGSVFLRSTMKREGLVQ